MTEKETMLVRRLSHHLIRNGMTFNAEQDDPVITRPVRVEEMAAVMLDFLGNDRLPIRDRN